MLDRKSIVTIGLVISSVVAGYVLWVKKEKKRHEGQTDDSEDVESKEESKDEDVESKE